MSIFLHQGREGRLVYIRRAFTAFFSKAKRALTFRQYQLYSRWPREAGKLLFSSFYQRKISTKVLPQHHTSSNFVPVTILNHSISHADPDKEKRGRTAIDHNSRHLGRGVGYEQREILWYTRPVSDISYTLYPVLASWNPDKLLSHPHFTAWA